MMLLNLKNNLRKRITMLAMLLPTMILLGIIGCAANNVTPREGSLSGKIIDQSGKAVEEALVSWSYDNTRWSLTDENGAYLLEGIGFGDQAFIVEAFGYRKSSFSASIFSGQVTVAASHTIEPKSFDYLEIKVSDISATHATIEWKTTDYTNGLVEYGETESLGRTVREKENQFATSHSVKLTDLSPEKQFFFRIVANREGRGSESSQQSSFTTLSSLEDKAPPSPPSGVSASLGTVPGQITVFWAPVADPDLKAYKVYRSDLPNSSFTLISNMAIPKGQERYNDTTVVPGRKYYYKVTAIDQAGNESGFNNLASSVAAGNIASEIVWTRANSPYHITGDMNVLPTGRLRIDSGVEILISDTDALRMGDVNRVEITVSGAIIASAGNQLPIIFASARSNPEKADWGGIRFIDVDNEENTLVNVLISDAETGLTIEKSRGIFDKLDIRNCNLGISCKDSMNLEISQLTTTRCTSGIQLNKNTSIKLTNSTFVHANVGISSQQNSNLIISGCNLIEIIDTGIITNELPGQIEITNNLFVSPQGTGLRILSQNPVVQYNTFDCPYAIQINSGNPLISKNLFMAKRSVFSAGKKGIEFVIAASPLSTVGPNNFSGFSEEVAHINCTASSDSSREEVLLMMDINGKTYDYRLRQAFPSLDDSWGINREEIPYDS